MPRVSQLPPTFRPQPLPSFHSFFCSALSPSPSSPAQKLSVHSHFLWLLSLSPDLMRTIWGKEGGREGGGEAGKDPPSSRHLSTPLRLCARQLAHFAPNSPNWILAAGVRGTEGKGQSRGRSVFKNQFPEAGASTRAVKGPRLHPMLSLETLKPQRKDLATTSCI